MVGVFVPEFEVLDEDTNGQEAALGGKAGLLDGEGDKCVEEWAIIQMTMLVRDQVGQGIIRVMLFLSLVNSAQGQLQLSEPAGLTTAHVKGGRKQDRMEC